MSGTSNWKTIRKQVIGKDEARAKRARDAMDAELALGPLRKHRKTSQADVAKRLAVSQANISQIERGDVKISTLAGYVGALGGKLEVRAVFDDETVSLSDVSLRNVKVVGEKIVGRERPRRNIRVDAKPMRVKGPRKATQTSKVAAKPKRRASVNKGSAA
jgi:transcriptional regulator with XRE-family HTH domain